MDYLLVKAPSPVLRVNTIDYVTIGTLGNATDFGDLQSTRGYSGACSSATRGLIAGAWNPSTQDIIDYVTISSTGSGFDFGNLTTAREQHQIIPHHQLEDFCRRSITGDYLLQHH